MPNRRWAWVGLIGFGLALGACTDDDAGLCIGEKCLTRRDAGPGDGGDVLHDAAVDAANDSGGESDDASIDAGDAADAGLDAGDDAGLDAGEDAALDAGLDAGDDAALDAGEDAGEDSGPPCVPTTEICNALDDDCDGVADEGLAVSAGEISAWELDTAMSSSTQRGFTSLLPREAGGAYLLYKALAPDPTPATTESGASALSVVRLDGQNQAIGAPQTGLIPD